MNIPIPPAALEAGARALREEVRRALNVVEPDPPEGPSPSLMEAYGNEARAAFEAMVEAWPGMAHYRGGWEPVIHNNRKPHLTLPLTENGNG